MPGATSRFTRYIPVARPSGQRHFAQLFKMVPDNLVVACSAPEGRGAGDDVQRRTNVVGGRMPRATGPEIIPLWTPN